MRTLEWPPGVAPCGAPAVRQYPLRTPTLEAFPASPVRLPPPIRYPADPALSGRADTGFSGATIGRAAVQQHAHASVRLCSATHRVAAQYMFCGAAQRAHISVPSLLARLHAEAWLAELSDDQAAPLQRACALARTGPLQTALAHTQMHRRTPPCICAGGA